VAEELIGQEASILESKKWNAPELSKVIRQDNHQTKARTAQKVMSISAEYSETAGKQTRNF
jgi:hypothetical protein